MSVESIIAITLAILSALAAPVIYLGKSVMSRLERLEENQTQFLKEEEVRRLLDDKMTPLQEDCKDIKESIHQLLDHVLKLKK